MAKKTFGEAVRELRILAEMSRVDLAAVTGLSVYTIVRVEQGKTGLHETTLKALRRWAPELEKYSVRWSYRGGKRDQSWVNEKFMRRKK